jgi:hypothetical protein
MTTPSAGSLVGQRRLPIEDVPDDAFERVLPREAPPARGQVDLITSLCALYAPGRQAPRFKRLIPVGEGVFGGRYLSGAGLVVYAHADAIIERAVTAHETCHFLRDVHSGDHLGEHNEAFLALCEDVYRVVGIPSSVARLVEGQYPQSWRW